jgi:hypothetical protein
VSPDELRVLARALRDRAQSYASNGREIPRALLEELRGAEARLAEWDAGRAGPALGLPGVPWDAFRNAVDPVPIRAAMPASLPGGRWGTGATRLTIQTDVQGGVVGGNPIGGGLLEFPFPVESRELARAEWPIPTAWVLQGSVDVTGTAGGEFPPQQLTGFPAGWYLEGYIEQSVENSTMRLPIRIESAGPFPLIQGITFQLNPVFGVWAATLVAQQIKVVASRMVTTLFDPTLLGTWNFNAVALLGLAAASLPPTREGTAR